MSRPRAAAGGAGEEDAFECRGAQDAAVQVGENELQIDGAEAGGERDEAGRCGAVGGGGGEMATVGEEGANDGEEGGDAWGAWVGRGGGIGDGERLTFHGSIPNTPRHPCQLIFAP
jgi:hypothetical protein